MKHIKPMTKQEFADYLLSMNSGDVIDFGADPGYAWPDETPEPDDVCCWYFAKKISIPEYGSNFILIDYCGGEEAFAIPLNNYRDFPDEDDKMIVAEYVERFWNNCDNIGKSETHVFVEIND